ncbi:lysine exporter LysO family protein [Burkholderia plantarii]|uniref:lysine exporter LysO family protein n=1 Tax=Burkholderia plantarii TaxID=41899 RepID=UPI0018DC6775|nr:lysine exporter LysO family protein [Burkholderia plantarii]MBI0326199.1 lysine exporter LysO family protein [Burkholderia plantarii]
MQALLTAIVPIFIALLAGMLVGRALPVAWRAWLAQLITPLVWLLLVSIGHRFGDVLSHGAGVRGAVGLALLFAALTTLVPWLLIAIASQLRRSREPRARTAATLSLATLLKPLRECVIAFGAVALGVAASLAAPPAWLAQLPWPSTDQLLYTLIGFVGMDMLAVRLDRASLSPKVLAIPAIVMVGSLAGGALAARLGGQPLPVALALSSGFGWFSLSGALVASRLGDLYGTVALLTDLFRELLAIVLLYSLGARFSSPCIGASGATALDSTLPVIKQTCEPRHIPTAMISGLILSLAAPFLISLFLTH